MASVMARHLLSLGLLAAAAALPQGSTPTDGDDGHIVVATPVTSTVFPSGTRPPGPPAEVTTNADPIPGSNSYFWLDYSCSFQQTPDGEDKPTFVKEAYNDATAIAKIAAQWPSKFRESADLYIGKNFVQSQYASDFQANLKAASEWEADTGWPFQSYVRVSCDDLRHICKNKIGTDPRAITAYANNTASTFGSTVWTITLCDPFFTLNSVKKIKQFHESIDPEDMQMIFMESSGEKFLHEAMHLTAITEKRDIILDETFDGGRRIYGPKDVARAARIANRDGFQYNYRNADTYAVFAQAAYWQDYYGLAIPPTSSRALPAPAGTFEFQGVSDSSSNYVDLVDGDTPPDRYQAASRSHWHRTL